MDLMWLVYLLNVVGNLSTIFVISSILLAAAVFATAIFFWMDNGLPSSEDKETVRMVGLWKKLAITAAILSLLAVFTPDEKTMYMMAGAYGTQKVIESPQGKQMADKIMTIVNAKVDEYVDEAVNGKKKKK